MDYQALEGWSTFSAALATSISAAFIVWQIRLTRKSVQSTELALELARQEFDRGALILDDAERGRIDADMPRLLVVASVMSQPFIDGRRDDWGDPLWSPDVEATEFITPRDANIKLGVTTRVTIWNDGPRRAQLTIGQGKSGLPNAGETIVVEPGTPYVLTVTWLEPLNEWIRLRRLYVDPQEGDETVDVVIFEAIYVHPGDRGATEYHSVHSGGSIVQPVEGHDGAWKLAHFEGVSDYMRPVAAPQPFTRQYYRSRLRGEALS